MSIDILDLGNPLLVAFLGNIGRKKGVNDGLYLVKAILSRTEREDIGTVVLAGISRQGRRRAPVEAFQDSRQPELARLQSTGHDG